MANQETRNCIVRAIHEFTNKSEFFNISDDGENFLIFINPKSVNVEFKYNFIDHEGFEEKPVYFEVEFYVWGGYKYNASPIIDNNIREFISELQIKIREALEDKKISDSLKKKIERMKASEIKKNRKILERNFVELDVELDAWEFLIAGS